MIPSGGSFSQKGKLVSADGEGTFSSSDGNGNLTSGSLAQSYLILHGQARLASSLTLSNTTNLDGSVQNQSMTVNYSYDAGGRLAGAEGSGTFSSNDGNGNLTTGRITQSYG